MGLFFYSILLAVFFIVSAYFSYRVTRFIIVMLRKQQIIDMPNDRSNHAIPTPRGGGLAIAGIIIAGFFIVSSWIGQISGAWPLLVASWVLGIVSFSDDVKGLPVRMRL